ncbi:ScbR family autoregulator-binding transcription factor [Streptomyces canus]|uniref:ScbR family autoregulator-binding transcription factor n=1 Tax=Streptomyces canus TaxID=58343 RepID=UPI002E381634|nr:ScbR family autoregulator-binding transcription factor [Streptomyces canus]
MVQQERAFRTRHVVLEAAAQVFAEHGYATARIADILKAAGVTKGALYFHFDSKEALAKGVLQLQTDQRLPPQETRLQEIVDITMTVAHRLPVDVVLRAGARLSADPVGREHYGSAWSLWADMLTGLLAQAHRNGELMAHAEPREIAELIVGAFNGVQLYSHLEHNLTDVEHRVSVLLNHLMPSIAAPAVLLRLDMAPDRGARTFTKANHPQTTVA